MSALDIPDLDDPLLSRLAFGVGRLTKHDIGTGYRTIRRAWDLGIRHFDGSVYYGHGVGHALMGRLIDDVGGDDLFISTKIGHMYDGFPDAKVLYRSADVLWGLVHECYRLLRGRIDLLQIHEADMAYWWSAPDEATGSRYVRTGAGSDFAVAPAVRVLERARDTGVCRFIGISGNTSGVLSRVAGGLQVDSVMCAYNLDPIFRGVQENLVPLARTRGFFLMAAGVAQGGSYVRPRDLHRWLHRDERIVERFERFAVIHEESGLSGAELVHRWMLSAPGVDRWVLGASHPDQVDETMRFLRNGPLPADLQTALDALALPGVEPFADVPE